MKRYEHAVWIMRSEFMEIEYRKADIGDAERLVEIYNASFYSDYIKYGDLPG